MKQTTNQQTEQNSKKVKKIQTISSANIPRPLSGITLKIKIPTAFRRLSAEIFSSRL
jgi:hypothetical protein